MQGDDNAVVDSEKDKNESRSTSKHAKVSVFSLLRRYLHSCINIVCYRY